MVDTSVPVHQLQLGLVSLPGNTPDKTGSVITEAYTGEDKNLEKKNISSFLDNIFGASHWPPNTGGRSDIRKRGQPAMSSGGGGKRKPVEEFDYGDGGLLDLGDVSHDLEALTRVPRNKDRLGALADLSEGDSAYDNLSSPGGDYDNLSSPGGSSTCSGPTYTRHLGFGPEPARPHSQVSAPGLAPLSRAPSSPPSPLTHSASQPQFGSQSLISRHRLPAQHSLENHFKQESKKKKKKSLLCPAFEENGGDIRGVQVGGTGDGGCQKQKTKVSSSKLGMATSRQRNKKGKK